MKSIRRVIGLGCLCYSCAVLALAMHALTSAAGAQADSAEGSIMKMLAAAFAAETRADYVAFYGFLSKRSQLDLLKQEKVRTAADYRKLRMSSEARWLQNELLSLQPRKNGKYVAVSRATVEETGETDRFCVRYTLILESGNWKIDEWEYLKVCPAR